MSKQEAQVALNISKLPRPEKMQIMFEDIVLDGLKDLAGQESKEVNAMINILDTESKNTKLITKVETDESK